MESDGSWRKGTVTPLASLVNVEEAQKAAKRVQGVISENEKELDNLQGFISDNTNIINLVQKLPEELYHDVMVPFGKAAFFPGRLIHTNEFMVLLGEGYYAQRTSKQTVDILQRRGKALDSQVDSLQAMIKDLRAEASFFISTASEAAEGLVEIREDYLEENLRKVKSSSGPPKTNTSIVSEADKRVSEDEEYAHIMAKLDELEKEELAAENATDSDDGDGNEVNDKSGESSLWESPADGIKYSQESQPKNLLTQLKDGDETTKSFPSKQDMEEHLADNLNSCLDVQNIFRDPSASLRQLDGKSSVTNAKNSDHGAKTAKLTEKKENIQPLATSSQVPLQSSTSTFDPSKAFTGSIVEHSENIQATTGDRNSALQQPSSQPSKPLSRFKMQRR